MLSTESQVQEYAKLVMELRGGAENLVEFLSTMQPPNDDFEIPNVSPQQLSRLRDAHKAMGELWESITEFQDEPDQVIRVTVKLESDFQHGESWVARDRRGAWRSYCKKHFANNAMEAVSMMYHANQVLSVTKDGDKAKAKIAD